MPLPTTAEGLRLAGYNFDSKATCRGKNCGREVHWYVTPKGKRMPFHLDPGEQLIPHFATCVDIRDPRFRHPEKEAAQ